MEVGLARSLAQIYLSWSEESHLSWMRLGAIASFGQRQQSSSASGPLFGKMLIFALHCTFNCLCIDDWSGWEVAFGPRKTLWSHFSSCTIVDIPTTLIQLVTHKSKLPLGRNCWLGPCWHCRWRCRFWCWRRSHSYIWNVDRPQLEEVHCPDSFEFQIHKVFISFFWLVIVNIGMSIGSFHCIGN